MSDFVIDIGSVFNGVRDLFPQKHPVARPKFVHEPFYGSLRDTEHGREMAVGNLRPVSCKVVAQGIVDAAPARALAFFAESSKRLFRNGRRPTQVKESVGRAGLKRLR